MKICIVGFSFISYTKAMERALSSMGHNVKAYIVDDISEEMDTAGSEIYKKEILEFNPDIFINYCANYKYLYIDSVFLNKLSSIKINILLDSIKYVKYGTVDVDLYDRVFVFEPKDKEYLKREFNVNAEIFQVGVDEFSFCEDHTSNKTLDLCFVGGLTKERRQFLDKICKFCLENGYTIEIYSKYFNSKNRLNLLFKKAKFKIKYPYLYKFLINKNITFDDCSKLYSKTKICLNKHINKHEGMNFRNFEIAFGNNFCLSDKRIQSDSYGLVDGINFAFYDDVEDCKRKIQYYLEHEELRKEIACNAAEYVREKYTIRHCLSRMLSRYNV